MERLSYRPDDGLEQILFQNPADLEGNYDILDLAARFAIGDGTVAQILTAIAEKIAAYEDSGLTPERVAELAQAEREGRLLVMPCKVGTRVWVIGQNCDLCHDMYAEEPCLFGSCEYKEVFESVFGYGMIDNFGKTVFLTREEAEAAMKDKQEEP